MNITQSFRVMFTSAIKPRKSVERSPWLIVRCPMTTTATTMVGFVPLLLENDPFWRPLAIAISGGISGATLLALYFVPAAHLLMKRRQPTPQLPTTRVEHSAREHSPV